MSSLGARMTAKVGPLPVWAWAVVILVGGYLAYRLTSSGGQAASSGAASSDGSSSGSSLDSETTPIGGSDGSPPASGQGGAADQLPYDPSALQGSVDALTAAVQMSPAFWPQSGDAGSGSVVPNDGSTYAPAVAAKPAAQTSSTATKTTQAAKSTAVVRYYTYAPGKAPKNRKGDEAPARGPAGTTLHFKSGQGYYYS